MKNLVLLLMPTLITVSFISISIADSEKVEFPKYSTTVELNITADKEITNEVYSYISRELRSIGDVKLVEDNPDWVINVVAMQTKNIAGHSTGVAFSVVVVAELHSVPILLEIVKWTFGISPKELRETQYMGLENSFTAVTAGQSAIQAHYLRVGSTENVQRICQGIVADFDAEQLKNAREIHEEMTKNILGTIPEQKKRQVPGLKDFNDFLPKTNPKGKSED